MWLDIYYHLTSFWSVCIALPWSCHTWTRILSFADSLFFWFQWKTWVGFPLQTCGGSCRWCTVACKKTLALLVWPLWLFGRTCSTIHERIALLCLTGLLCPKTIPCTTLLPATPSTWYENGCAHAWYMLPPAASEHLMLYMMFWCSCCDYYMIALMLACLCACHL